MAILGFFIGNLTIFLAMMLFSLAWNAGAYLPGRRRTTGVIHSYSPSRKEWAKFYWRRARVYFFSYLLVLAVMMMLPAILNRTADFRRPLLLIANLVPGLILYFVAAGLFRPRIIFFPEGFALLALISFLPGRRDYKSRTYSDFRIGLRFWRDYNDAVPRGDVLIVRKQKGGGIELPIPHGQRDQLLELAREGLKKAREAKRRARKEAGTT